MATSKTLTPTNVTISIPEFTDQPDQRVNSNCIDKEADAINALNSQIANIMNIKSENFNIPTTTLSSLSPTAVSVGQVANLIGVPGLTQDKVVCISCNQTSLTPSSIIICGMYNNNVYIAATQSCTVGSSTGINGTVYYHD